MAHDKPCRAKINKWLMPYDKPNLTPAFQDKRVYAQATVHYYYKGIILDPGRSVDRLFVADNYRPLRRIDKVLSKEYSDDKID